MEVVGFHFLKTRKAMKCYFLPVSNQNLQDYYLTGKQNHPLSNQKNEMQFIFFLISNYCLHNVNLIRHDWLVTQERHQ